MSTSADRNLSDSVVNVTSPTAATSLTAAASTSMKLNFMVQPTPQQMSSAPMDPLSHVGDGIFLQTKTAQGLAGIFVWVALFITCQQVIIWILCYLIVSVSHIHIYYVPFADLSTFTLVYKSSRTTLDCAHLIHCPHICDIFLDQSIVFQFG